jgi:dihydroneopterin aldolase
MSKIVLEGLEFYAYHGCFTEEQKIGCNYIIDLELYTDINKASENDNLDETINYSEVYNTVKQEMLKPSKLIEHVAGRILNQLFSGFEKLDRATIKISKINPPVGGQIKSAGVVLEKWRNK